MPYNALNINRDFGCPRVQVWKGIQFRSGTISVVAGTPHIVQVQSALGLPTLETWLLGAYNVMGFWITSDQFSGALQVELSHDGTTFVQTESFPISGENTPDSLSGFELVGFCARFTLFNNGGTAIMRTWLEVRSF
jgi:hypothetical protein